MKKILTLLLSALMIFTLTACGADGEKTSATEKNSDTEKTTSNSAPAKKNLVVYFSCTENTKKLAERTAEILQADLYEIKPEVPYTAEDLNWHDETTRATVEQRDDKARPALADKNAPVADYQNIIIAFPIWWGIAPRIIETFVETYDLSGKNIIPICTSGGSDIGTSAEYLKKVSGDKGNWQSGKCFFAEGTQAEIKNYFNSLRL